MAYIVLGIVILALIGITFVLYRRLHEAQQKLHETETQYAVLHNERDHLTQRLTEEEEKNKNLGEEMRKDFELLSRNLLQERTEELEKEGRKGLHEVLAPFKEQIQLYRDSLDKMHKEQHEGRIRLDTQIDLLVRETHKIGNDANQLAQAMRGQSKIQGNWGEEVLRRLLEVNGLKQHVLYDSEVQLSTPTGEAIRHTSTQRKLRPDVLVSLPEGRGVVIDSKVSLKAYADYYNATEKEEKERFLKEHIRSVREHISELSLKQYPEHWQMSDTGIQVLDFTLLFIPLEDALQVALSHEEILLDEAYRKQIILVTPLQLVPVLKILSDLWVMHTQQQNVQDIVSRANNMYDKLSGIVDAMLIAQKEMTKAQQSLDTAVARMSEGRGNLVSQFEGLKKLGLSPKKQLPIVPNSLDNWE